MSSSTRRTLTVISSPGVTTCDVSDTRDHPISDTWSRPCTPGPEVDEGAELAHGRDAPGQHRASDDRSPDLGGARPLILLEQRTPRDDEVLAAFLVLDDPERVDATNVLRRVRVPEDVDLGDRAEGALSGDAHLVSALHGAFDLAFHWQTGVERVFELPVGRRPARQPPGECQPSLGGHDHRLDAVADSNLEHALGVLQLVDLDQRLALAADVDEHLFAADRDDRALDGLPPLEALRLKRRLEQRGEIFFGIDHGVLLVMVTLRRTGALREREPIDRRGWPLAAGGSELSFGVTHDGGPRQIRAEPIRCPRAFMSHSGYYSTTGGFVPEARAK